jgi:hypothetical protein
MRDPRFTRAYVRIIVIALLLILLLLGGFQSIWVFAGSASSIMVQVGLQRTRGQAIAKDVLILAYRPESEHIQAISELQNALPLFEQTQKGLQVGDSSLMLPNRIADEIVQLVAATQPDFVSIDTAVKVILAQVHAHPDAPIDPTQRDIILAHEHGYVVAMSAVNSAWQARIESAFLHLYEIETGHVVVLIALIGGNYFFVTRRIYNQLVEEAKTEQKETS